MRIRKISVRNLKLLDSIELGFGKDVTLLYGKNGIGKTTFLEAISLLGHLSTMRRVQLKKGSVDAPTIRPSHFWQELAAGNMHPTKEGVSFIASRQVYDRFNKQDSFSDLADSLKEAKCDLNEWFNKKLIGSAVRFEVEFDKNKKVAFCVYKKEETDKTKRISITQSLGRKKSDDLKMNETFAVIWEDNDDAKYITSLIESYMAQSTYIISLETLGQKTNSSELYYFLKHSNPVVKSTPSNGYVFYLNTDLNDFGRMRDIRESVKDLESDFLQEWIQRFNLQFTTSLAPNPDCREFDSKSDLELLMNRVISKSSPFTFRRGLREFLSILFPFLPKMPEGEKMFELTDCCITGDNELDLRAKREGYEKPERIDYLSAAENECFFIFLYLLGTEIKNSICLLDEPDLHLSQFAKRPFFENLFAMLRDNDCQVIISTHSGFAYTHPKYTERYLLRRLSKPAFWEKRIPARFQRQYPRFDTKFTFAFQFGMAAHYWRTALGVLGISGGIQMVILVLMFFSAGSFISDVFQQNGPVHMIWTHYFTSPAIVISSVLVYFQLIRYVFRDVRGNLEWRDME
jgi:predicted ATP-dependent endonuclease of OLD family